MNVETATRNHWASGVSSTLAGANTTDRILAIDGINATVMETNVQLSECIAELAKIADDLLGGRAQQDGRGEPSTPVSSRVDGLNRNTTDTRKLVGILRDEIARFRAL